MLFLLTPGARIRTIDLRDQESRPITTGPVRCLLVKEETYLIKTDFLNFCQPQQNYFLFSTFCFANSMTNISFRLKKSNAFMKK